MNVVASKTSRFARFVHSREAFENAASFMLARSAFAEAISAVRQRNSCIQKWMPGYLGNNAFRKVLLGCGYTFHPFSNRARAHAQKKTRQRVAQRGSYDRFATLWQRSRITSAVEPEHGSE
ncbi:hypothetical protein V1477_000242, partial [Vespula maculifrons]